MLKAFYDGQCWLCQSSCAALRALDWRQRIEFLDLHASDLRTQAQLLGEIHVLDEAGQLHVGFYGLRRLLKATPLGFPLWLLLHLPGLERLGPRLYRAIARRRYKINKLLGRDLAACATEACKLP